MTSTNGPHNMRSSNVVSEFKSMWTAMWVYHLATPEEQELLKAGYLRGKLRRESFPRARQRLAKWMAALR